jgi:hypothetical protein
VIIDMPPTGGIAMRSSYHQGQVKPGSTEMSEHDITINWGNKPSYNRFKTTIDVQDAGNLRALAREFVKVVDQASEATQSTTATWDDPAVVLFVNKFESLCRSEDRFSTAYKMCQEKAL